jgi:hypothetical protein
LRFGWLDEGDLLLSLGFVAPTDRDFEDRIAPLASAPGDVNATQIP